MARRKSVLDLRAPGAIRKNIAKADLPHKVCVTCGRPFAWRKKWERVWADVKYCSGKCRAKKSS